MIRKFVGMGLIFTASFAAVATDLTLLIPETSLQHIASEISGVRAKRNLDQITLYHRMRASDGFNKAAAHVLAELQASGYANAEILRFPADGKSMFGTQKSRFAWNVNFAELWELKKQDGVWVRSRRHADWAARPLTLAQDSNSADVEAELVDIGVGTTAANYAGKDVRGKIVLTSSQPSAVEQLAIRERGAVGVLSYAANQKSAWWQLDDSLVRWGHLSSFREFPAFGFMTTLGEARKLKARLALGEKIRFHAKIEARHEVGEYQIVSAVFPGADPSLTGEEIVFSCHLDHPRPGANDNASGCVAILEAARALKTLVATGRIAAPKRTIRFIWPSEIEATLILLNAKPELAARIKHAIHMDMVGGGPVTKAVFRVSRGPVSTANIAGEIAELITSFVNKHTLAYAGGETTAFPLSSTEGGREPLLAQKEWLSRGSDHDVFAAGSWGIPITYLHDWPDRYIHTTKDLAANIDPTKLKRSAFIGLVQAITLANLGDEHVDLLRNTLRATMTKRAGNLLSKHAKLSARDMASATRGHWAIEHQLIETIKQFAPAADVSDLHIFANKLAALTALTEIPAQSNGIIYRRNTSVKGTMRGFGYSYLTDKLGSEKQQALLLPKEPMGGDKSYEALNLVNGIRSVSEIHDVLVAEFGPVSMQALTGYLGALESIGVLEK